MSWITAYAVLFGTALIAGLVLTPLFIRLAVRVDFMDLPAGEAHKRHKKATPLLGGMAIFSALVLTAAAAWFGWMIFRDSIPEEMLQAVQGIHFVKRELIILLICAAGAAGLGLYDDKHALKAWQKLTGQIVIAGAAALWGGASITVFIPNGFISFAITVFWFVLMFNAVNFFDNMDGLAVGMATIAFLFFMTTAIVNEQYFVSALAAVSAGAAMGFWFYNKTPAQLFMGDSGSHLLAFLLAYLSTRVTYFTPGVSATKLNVLIPLFILAIPLLDTLTVVIIRLRNHKPVYIGDHNHISHRFWHMGISRASAVTMVHLLCLISGLGALPLLRGDVFTSILLVIQGLVLYCLICYIQYAVTKGADHGTDSPVSESCGK